MVESVVSGDVVSSSVVSGDVVSSSVGESEPLSGSGSGSGSGVGSTALTVITTGAVLLSTVPSLALKVNLSCPVNPSFEV